MDENVNEKEKNGESEERESNKNAESPVEHGRLWDWVNIYPGTNAGE